MVLDNGVHSSLHTNSHHQLVFVKIFLKIYYFPPYKKRVCYYNYTNTFQIKNTLVSFNWEQVLSNSSFNKKISVLNETIVSVMSNYISNGIKVSDGFYPPLMNAEIENLINAKDKVFLNYLKNNRNHYYTYKYKAFHLYLHNQSVFNEHFLKQCLFIKNRSLIYSAF